MKSGYFTITWNRRDHGASKMNHHQHTKGWTSSKEGDVVYMVGLEGSLLLWAPSGKPNNQFQQELLQIRPTVGSTGQKASELVNRKCIIFHQDNARLHVSLMTRQKLLQLGWEVLIHPPYSPDVASSDFHLFWSLENSLHGKNFYSPKDWKRILEQFFARKS